MLNVSIPPLHTRLAEGSLCWKLGHRVWTNPQPTSITAGAGKVSSEQPDVDLDVLAALMLKPKKG